MVHPTRSNTVHDITRNTPDDSKNGHLSEAIIRLEAIEGGLARVVLGLQSVDTLPAYIELCRIARRHLAAVA